MDGPFDWISWTVELPWYPWIHDDINWTKTKVKWKAGEVYQECEVSLAMVKYQRIP